MILIALLISAIYVLFLSAKYFLIGDYSDHYWYHNQYGGLILDETILNRSPSEKIQKIMTEVKDTESNYVQILTKLDTNYFTPLIKYTEKYYTDKLKRFIYNKIDSLLKLKKSLELNKELLNLLNDMKLDKLQDVRKLSQWLFSNFERLVEGYKGYGKNYRAWVDTFIFMEKKNIKYGQMPIANTIQFTSDMITPIQRLGRYELLFKTIYEQIKKDHPDLSELIAELDITKNHINATLMSYNKSLAEDNESKLFEILAKVGYPESIMEYNVDNGLKIEHIVQGTVTSVLKQEIPVTYYICSKVMFYISNKPDSEGKIPPYKVEQTINYRNIKLGDSKSNNLQTFVNKSMLSTEKYNLIYTPPPKKPSQTELDYNKEDATAYGAYMAAINYIKSPYRFGGD